MASYRLKVLSQSVLKKSFNITMRMHHSFQK